MLLLEKQQEEGVQVSENKQGHTVEGKTMNFELKELPSNLKYVYLGPESTLPVIISSKLTTEQEERLVQVLVEKKKAIG